MGYRGTMYAYDAKRRKLLTNYYAGGGIFFIYKQYIFAVGNPEHENAEDPFYTLVDVYRIKGKKFHYMGFMTLNGEYDADDTSIVKLYNKVIKYDGRQRLGQPK